MKFTQKQADFIKKEMDIDIPADKDIKLDKDVIEKILLEAFYIEGDESADDGGLSERGKIAESIINMSADIRAGAGV